MTQAPEVEPEDDEPVIAETLLRCIEALLMAADRPLSVDQLIRLLETTHATDRADMRLALQALTTRYEQAAINLVEIAGGWRFQIGPDYAALVARLWEERPPKLSRAMLETLALIVYRQPIARSDIEAVRGVSVSTNIVKTLQEFDWIKVVGHRDMPGRPALFGTTGKFLDDFGVRRLTDLPSLPEIKDLDALDAAVARLHERPDSDSADPAQDDGDAYADTNGPSAQTPACDSTADTAEDGRLH